jgi:serine protease Do
MKKNVWINRLIWSVAIPLFAGIIGGTVLNRNTTNSNIRTSTSGSMVRNVALKTSPDGFEKASAISTASVVFIKTESTVAYRSSMGWFWDFDPFGRKGTSKSTGSGVILSADGYIVTNNHVVQGANKITVVLNENEGEYEAKVIGTDPSSDLAVLKIEANDLPAIAVANSDDVQVGNWVLAVGNPFNLNSTVTAGIVSAKGRDINIVRNQFPIESFIQTDAAINPGNSGGALVNTRGELVGINTAIQSKTGSYTGYGFAIPSNIVFKIATDFMKFGALKKAFAGFEVRNVTSAEKKSLKLNNVGVKVTQVLESGIAEKLGIQKGDIILSIDGKRIAKKAMFDETLAYHRPKDIIKLSLLRNSLPKTVELSLMSKADYTRIVDKGLVESKVLGAGFQRLTAAEKERYGIEKGLKVRKIKPGSTAANLRLSEGYIIMAINGISYNSPEDLISAMESIRGRISIKGLNASGQRSSMSFSGY